MPVRSRARRCFGAVTVTSVLLWAASAHSDGRVQFLTERLAYPPGPGQRDDFRVRTNAALALAATNEDAAVAPLCLGLADPSEVVRQAVAVGLRRLARPSSVTCLKERAAQEPSATVKAEIGRTLAAIASARGTAPPGAPQLAGAKYYVALSHVANHTSRPSAEVDQVVRDAIVATLVQRGQVQIAPIDETLESAKGVVAKRQLKGYFLAIRVEKFDYSDDGLRVRVKIAVFSYPGKDLRGEIPASGTLPGARPGDKSGEDQLMTVIAGRAAELFAENFK